MKSEIDQIQVGSIDDVYCSMFEQVIEDQMIINYSEKVVAKESKVSIRSVTPYTKTQVNFLNGNQFFGDINRCRMTGNGRYLWADDGSLYEGEFNKPNIIEGRGAFKFSNREKNTGSSKYCGSFVDEQFHGKGQLNNNFFKFNGNFEHNRFHGIGSLKSGIESFDGNFIMDKKVSGKRIYANGMFIGDFDADETRKSGKYRFDNGDAYCGAFAYGMFTGYGEYTWSCKNAKYAGNWRDGKRDGLGMLTVDGITCVTTFRMSVKDGPGVVLARDGKVYAAKRMFQRDEFIGCQELKVEQKNVDTLRNLMNAKEMETRCGDVAYFTSMVSVLVEDFGKSDAASFPFHLNWFELKVDHQAIWNFIKNFPDTSQQQEIESITQTIKEFTDVFQDLHQRYADFSSKAAAKPSTGLLRLGLWQLLRDLELYKKSDVFNSQAMLDDADREFNIMSINPENPFALVSISCLVQYLMYVTLRLNQQNDFVLSCAINQRSRTFGLFGTMLVICLREFIAPLMANAFFSGETVKLIRDDRTFITNFISIVDLNQAKLTLQSVFNIVELWKAGAKDELNGN